MATTLDLAAVRALVAEHDPEGRLTPCPIEELVMGPGALGLVASIVERLVGARSDGRPSVVLLVDDVTILRAGADVKAQVESDLAATFAVRRVVLTDGHPELHVTASVIEQAVESCADAQVVVALGSGTISDIAKLAVARRPGQRLLTVMTAASVDGYTDNVSVLLKDGVKRTVPSVWPDAVLADAETVAAAPPRMNRAGYGEMTSMYVAPADWRLAALVGIDPSFHRAPLAILEVLGDSLDECAPGVAAGEPGAVHELTAALALRGIATGLSGSTACLSGVEHMVSHMLDLRAAAQRLPTGLHGEQVGAGSVVAACAWEMLHDRVAAEPGARVWPAALDRNTGEARVRMAFERIDASGRIGGECWSDYSRKLDRVKAALPALNATLERWEEHAPELRSLARPSARIAAGLRSAGTPALLSELGGEIDERTTSWVVRNCALMRDRFTVVDLLTLLGWWRYDDVAEIERRVLAAVTGAEVGA